MNTTESTMASSSLRPDPVVPSSLNRRSFLMRNAVNLNPDLQVVVDAASNVTVTEATHGSGVYEAIVGRLMQRS